MIVTPEPKQPAAVSMRDELALCCVEPVQIRRLLCAAGVAQPGSERRENKNDAQRY